MEKTPYLQALHTFRRDDQQYLDVLLCSALGERSMLSCMAGGDYDGDGVFCWWGVDVSQMKSIPPLEYPEFALVKKRKINPNPKTWRPAMQAHFLKFNGKHDIQTLSRNYIECAKLVGAMDPRCSKYHELLPKALDQFATGDEVDEEDIIQLSEELEALRCEEPRSPSLLVEIEKVIKEEKQKHEQNQNAKGDKENLEFDEDLDSHFKIMEQTYPATDKSDKAVRWRKIKRQAKSFVMNFLKNTYTKDQDYFSANYVKMTQETRKDAEKFCTEGKMLSRDTMDMLISAAYHFNIEAHNDLAQAQKAADPFKKLHFIYNVFPKELMELKSHEMSKRNPGKSYSLCYTTKQDD